MPAGHILPSTPPGSNVVNTLFFGIVAGLTAAFFSSVSYLVSRHHGTREKHASRRLLIFAHVLMGFICGTAAWSTYSADTLLSGIWHWSIWLPCVVSTGTYLFGTSAVFRVLTRADASRLSPLLGLKIIALGLIVSLVFGQTLSIEQWFAVMLCAAAAILLQQGGSGLPVQSLILLSCGCICFAIADLGIVEMINAIQTRLPLSRFSAGCLALLSTYVFIGLIVSPLTLFEYARQPCPTIRDWRAAAEYSAAWLLAMFGLYACIGYVGVILSTILQSTRGIMSVILGAILSGQGWHQLESRVERHVFFRRLIAALCMTTAVALYVVSNHDS